MFKTEAGRPGAGEVSPFEGKELAISIGMEDIGGAYKMLFPSLVMFLSLPVDEQGCKQSVDFVKTISRLRLEKKSERSLAINHIGTGTRPAVLSRSKVCARWPFYTKTRRFQVCRISML